MEFHNHLSISHESPDNDLYGPKHVASNVSLIIKITVYVTKTLNLQPSVVVKHFNGDKTLV
jgi:hypothetical protein